MPLSNQQNRQKNCMNIYGLIQLAQWKHKEHFSSIEAIFIETIGS